MREASTKPLRKPLRKLDHLLLDTDVNPTLLPYLQAVGFRVRASWKQKINIHDDVDVVRWAKRHNYIVVTHDKYKDRETRFKICQEIYEHGGHAIQVSRGKKRHHPLETLAMILLFRQDWIKFFAENDGMVLLHEKGITLMPRAYLLRQIQATLPFPTLPPIRRKVTARKPKQPKATPRDPLGPQMPFPE